MTEREIIQKVTPLAVAGLSAYQIETLLRAGRKMNRLDTAICNGEHPSCKIEDEKESANAEYAAQSRIWMPLVKRGDNRVHDAILDIVNVRHQPDPRGASLIVSRKVADFYSESDPILARV